MYCVIWKPISAKTRYILQWMKCVSYEKRCIFQVKRCIFQLERCIFQVKRCIFQANIYIYFSCCVCVCVCVCLCVHGCVGRWCYPRTFIGLHTNKARTTVDLRTKIWSSLCRSYFFQNIMSPKTFL